MLHSDSSKMPEAKLGVYFEDMVLHVGRYKSINFSNFSKDSESLFAQTLAADLATPPTFKPSLRLPASLEATSASFIAFSYKWGAFSKSMALRLSPTMSSKQPGARSSSAHSAEENPPHISESHIIYGLSVVDAKLTVCETLGAEY
jgi:hypothetical protein